MFIGEPFRSDVGALVVGVRRISLTPIVHIVEESMLTEHINLV